MMGTTRQFAMKQREESDREAERRRLRDDAEVDSVDSLIYAYESVR
jgi:hypothetical protein